MNIRIAFHTCFLGGLVADGILLRMANVPRYGTVSHWLQCDSPQLAPWAKRNNPRWLIKNWKIAEPFAYLEEIDFDTDQQLCRQHPVQRLAPGTKDPNTLYFENL